MNLSSSESSIEMRTADEDIEEESNQVRRAYRTIRDHINDHHLDFVDPNSDLLENTLTDVEKNLKKVKKPREGVSDSHVFLQLVRLSKERIKNVHCEFRSFSNTEFMDKMKLFMINCAKTNLDGSNRTQIANELENMSADDNNYEPMDDVTLRDENDVDDDAYNRTMTSSKQNSKAAKFYVLKRPILESFGLKAMSYFKILPKPTFLIGSLEKNIQIINKRKQAKINDIDKLEQARTKIQELDANSNENDTHNTLTETERIFSILKKNLQKIQGRSYVFL